MYQIDAGCCEGSALVIKLCLTQKHPVWEYCFLSDSVEAVWSQHHLFKLKTAVIEDFLQ